LCEYTYTSKYAQNRKLKFQHVEHFAVNKKPFIFFKTLWKLQHTVENSVVNNETLQK